MHKPADQNPVLAALLIVVACAFVAAATLFAKALGSADFGAPVHPLQITFGRFLFAFIGICLVCTFVRPTFGHIHWGLHVGRTTFGWAGGTFMFAAVAYIPLADATAISFLNPVVAMVLAIPLLGEKVGPWRWLAAAISLTGALILLRPAPDSFEPAALLALAAAVAFGFELIFIRKLATGEAPLPLLAVNNALGLLISGAAALLIWSAPTAMQWALMAGVGISIGLAQAFFVNGVARGEASFVAPFSYATLVFAALFDLAVFGVLPDWVSATGATIIIAGALLLAYREAIAHRRRP